MDKSSVPRFASFKPKSKPGASDKDDSTQRESAGNSGSGEHRDRSKKQDRRHDRHDGDRTLHRRERSGDRHRRHHSRELSSAHHHRMKRERGPDQPQPIAKAEFEESNLFLVDRRGDAKNVEYGSLHRYSIPAYHRSGYGHVIGSCKKIDRDASTDKEVILMHPHARTERQPRPLTSKRGRMKDTRLRLIAPNVDSSLIDIDSDYIELRAPRKRKRGSESPETEALPSVDYRSIEGKAKAAAGPADEDLEYASDSDAASTAADPGLVFRQQNAVLSKQAKSQATELEPWLALVEHQSKLVRPGGSSEVRSFTSSERRTLSDLRLSILKEACAHISKGRPGRERLLLAMIEEGALFWDSSKLAAKWKEALSECSSSIILWTKYLDYVQDNHASFRYEICKGSYLQCLSLLRQTYEKAKDDQRRETSHILIYVTLRFTTFIRDAGYDELAIATWQALLEYHCFAPVSVLNLNAEHRLKALEDFWDSEAPRIGEDGGQGWSRSESNTMRNPVQPMPAELDPRSPFTSFSKEEARLQMSFALSAAADDDTATDDPFRYVMYSDIRDILLNLSTDLPQEALIDAFLHYMGMPPLEGASPPWRQDPHISCWSCIDPRLDTELATVRPIDRQEDTTTLFRDAFLPASHAKSISHPRLYFLNRVLEALLDSVSSERLAEYYISLKAHIFPDVAAKTAKRLLKTRPTSLRLYNAYALVEAHLGREEKAQEVWTTALRMRGSLGLEAQEDVALLWHSRLLTLARKLGDAPALESLLAISETTGDSRSRQLRTTRELESGFDRSLLSKKLTHAASLADLLAWLTYLTAHDNITAALDVYRSYDAKLAGAGMQGRELVHQHKSTLIKHHMTNKRQYKPSVLRDEVEQSVALFPNNSMLLELQIELAAQDRLRILVHEHKVLDPAKMTVIQWSYKLADELQRAEALTYGSTANTVRSTFFKALLHVDSAVGHSPALWTMWLRWECGRPKGESRAKQVFLDGLRRLPWLKRWVIMGMNRLDAGDNELRQWHEVLVERGLRVRLEIDQ